MKSALTALGLVAAFALLGGSASAQTEENGIIYEGTPQPAAGQVAPQPQQAQQGTPPQAAPPPPPNPQPAPPPSGAAGTVEAAQGQWLNTDNGWIWVPAGAQTTPVDGVPYAYLYSPAYGWTWYASPWGWGPYAYGPWIYHPWPFGFRAWGYGPHGWGWRGGRGVARYGGHYGGHYGYAGGGHYTGGGHYGGGHFGGGGHGGGGHGGGGHR